MNYVVRARSWLGIFVALATFLLGTAAVRAESTPDGQFAFSVELPAGKVTPDSARAIVIKAAMNRGWTVKQDTAEKVVVYLNHRKNEATVTLLISEGAVKAYCEGYATNGSGTRKGPEQPVRWLNNLKQDISIGLGVAPAGKS